LENGAIQIIIDTFLGGGGDGKVSHEIFYIFKTIFLKDTFLLSYIYHSSKLKSIQKALSFEKNIPQITRWNGGQKIANKYHTIIFFAPIVNNGYILVSCRGISIHQMQSAIIYSNNKLDENIPQNVMF